MGGGARGGRVMERKPPIPPDGVARRRCRARQRAGRTGARAAGRGPQPGRSYAGAARSDPEKDRGAGNLVQSSRGQQGTATAAGGYEARAGAERISEKREEQSMTIGNSVGKTSAAWIAIAALLLAPAVSRAPALQANPVEAAESPQGPQDSQDKEQEK